MRNVKNNSFILLWTEEYIISEFYVYGKNGTLVFK